jgi:hypothetical protein
MGLLAGACTEPNPYLPVSEDGTSTGAAMSSSSGSSGSSTTTATGDGSGSGSSSGGEPSCAEQGMECVPAAPDGFSGPFAWLERPIDLALPCSSPFDQELVEAFSDISAPAAGCDCDCGPLTGASCDGAASVDRHAAAGCAGAVADSLDLVPDCNPIVPPWPSTSFFFDAPDVVGGACVPLPTVELVPAAFLTRHVACAGAFAAAGCEPGHLCAPPPGDPFHARWCVWQEGDVACPEGGAYGERTLLYRDIDDQRGCQQCTCAVPSVPCEGASVGFHSAGGCGALLGAVLANDCVDGLGGSGMQSLFYVTGSPPSACDPAVVVPTGDASGIEPVTFCCM